MTILGDLCSFKAGVGFPQAEQGAASGDLPWIKVSDLSLGGNGLRIEHANNWVTREQAQRLKAVVAERDAVVFAKIGEGLKAERLRTLTRPTALDNNLMAASVREGVCDRRFLYYLLSNLHLSDWAVGSALPYLTQKRLTEIPVSPRSLPQQRAIAEVLGALDDKIAANEQITSLVQQAAATLFVARVAAGELTTKTYADIADVGGGGTPSTREASYWDGGVNWASPTDITALSAPYLDATAKTITDEGLRAGSSPLYPEMSVLMTSRATIGAFAMTIAPTTVNQGFIVAQAKDPAGAWWLFHEMQTRIDNYRAYANGATFLELPRGRFKALSVEWPSDSELRLFHDIVDPLHRRAYAAMVESRKLAALRDALLPELMSGGLTVKDAETQVEEVV